MPGERQGCVGCHSHRNSVTPGPGLRPAATLRGAQRLDEPEWGVAGFSYPHVVQPVLDALLEQIGISGNITFVVHDWGSALGFDWAYRHPGKVKGIAYMEAILVEYEWSDWPDDARKIFQGFRSPAGEELILEKNYFVELVLPTSIMRGLSEEEMNVYRRPFLNPGEGRRPCLSWPRRAAGRMLIPRCWTVWPPSTAASAALKP